MRTLALRLCIAMPLGLTHAAPLWAQSAPPRQEAIHIVELLPMALSFTRFITRSGELARDRATDARLAILGEALAETGPRLNHAFEEAAQAAGIAAPDQMAPFHRAFLAEMTERPDFDPAFLAAQSAVWEEAVGQFRLFAQNAQDGPVRLLVSQILPELEQRLGEIRILHLDHDET